MDTTDWIIWSLLLWWSVSGFIHYSKVQKQMRAENLNDGFVVLKLLFVLLLPWAIWRAEKDYSEQENNR